MHSATDGLSRPAQIAVGLLWASAILVGLVLGYRRFVVALASDQPDFLTYFMPAAEALARGELPWSVPGYLYPPVIALILVPLVGSAHAAEAWTLLLVTAAVAACPLAVLGCARRLPSWKQALITAFAYLTLLYSWTATFDLFFGTPNMLVVLSLATSAFAIATGRRLLVGLGLGLAALLKSWPAAFAIWLVRRPLRLRGWEWAGVGLSAATATAIAWWIGGWKALVLMASVPFGATDQPVRAFSVWGVPKLLFSDTKGLGTPLMISPDGRVATTAILGVWVIALLVIALRHPGDEVLSLYNVVFVILLLLPVSHDNYQLFSLPALWWWAAECVAKPRSARPWLVTSILCLWWVIVFRANQFSSFDPFYLSFAAIMAAATASVLGAAWPTLSAWRRTGSPRAAVPPSTMSDHQE